MVTKNARLAAKAQALAEAQATKDRELLEALQKRSVETPEAAATQPKASLGDNFVSIAAMLKQTKRETGLQEATLIKVWELTLMWELNNRSQQQQQQQAFDPKDFADFVDGNESPATADEMIGESTDIPQETVNE